MGRILSKHERSEQIICGNVVNSSNRDTCSEGAQTVEYQILYAFFTDVCYTEGYSEPYVGPCHLLNLDMTAIKLVWKYTKRNSSFGRETASAFVTTTVSHRKLLFLLCEI